MLKLNKFFLILTVLIFTAEVCIAIFLESGFIRYTFGDVLASILIYTFIRSIANLKPRIVAIMSLCISFTLEGLQYIQFTKLIHQEDNKILNIVLGNHFSIEDLIAYTIGVLIIYYIDKNYLYEKN